MYKNVFIISICLNTGTISSMYLGHRDASTSHSTNEKYRHLPPFDRDVHGLPHWLSGILNNPLIYLANSSGLFQKWDIGFNNRSNFAKRILSRNFPSCSYLAELE